MLRAGSKRQRLFLSVSPHRRRRFDCYHEAAQPVVAADAGRASSLCSVALGRARLHSAFAMRADALSRQAIRLAQRESRKAGRPLTREEILALHVQTLEPWKRGVVIAIGLLAAAFAVVCSRGGAPLWFWASAAAGALAIILAGAFGRRVYLERELQKLTEDAPRRILDAISNAL